MWKQLALNYTICWILLSYYGSKVSSSDPLDCDFETGYCNWVQSKHDELDWTRISGAESTNYTGPNGDHTTGDSFYAYIDSNSEEIKNRSRAWLTSPTKTNGTYCFSLWYYMYGNYVDTLKVYKGKDGWKELFKIEGSKGHRWSLKRKNITSQTNFRIIIFGRLHFVDSRDYGIIAIDDILMFSGKCPPGCDDPTPTFGYVDPKNFKPGSLVKVACLTGYTLKGRSSITCQANGSWSGEPECNPIDCLTPRIANGSIVNMSASTTFNSSLHLACNAGYRLQGDTYVTCQADGNWSILPVCLIINCFTPSVLHGITPGIEKGTSSTYNQTVRLDCADGYTLSGNRLVTCQSDGNWSSLPECLVQDSSSKPLTILYILGPIVVVILTIIILSILLRKVFHKHLTKNFCFRNKRSRAESGNDFCNITYSGHEIETQSDREPQCTQDTGNKEDAQAQNRNEKNIFTVNCNALDTTPSENEYKNDNYGQLETIATDILDTTYSQVTKNNSNNDLQSNYDTTVIFSRAAKQFQPNFQEKNNRYDYLEVNNLKKSGDGTQNGIQKDLDPTYDHTYGNTGQINQNDYSHLIEMPLNTSESKEICECEYVNTAAISETKDEVCYENTFVLEEKS